MKVYQELLMRLQCLQEYLILDDQGDTSQQLQDAWSEVKGYFQDQIIPLTSDRATANLQSRWLSIQTELHRAYRLLELDLLKLRSSRQAETKQQRLQTLRDRVTQMINYCQLLLTQREL